MSDWKMTLDIEEQRLAEAGWTKLNDVFYRSPRSGAILRLEHAIAAEDTYQVRLEAQALAAAEFDNGDEDDDAPMERSAYAGLDLDGRVRLFNTAHSAAPLKEADWHKIQEELGCEPGEMLVATLRRVVEEP